MLVSILITVAVILGVVAYYMNVVAPKRNPIIKADAFLKQNMINEAILEYRKALEKSPKNFNLHYKLAQLYFKVERIDQGALHLEEVMRIGIFNYEVEKMAVMRKLAQVYQQRDEQDEDAQPYGLGRVAQELEDEQHGHDDADVEQAGDDELA